MSRSIDSASDGDDIALLPAERRVSDDDLDHRRIPSPSIPASHSTAPAGFYSNSFSTEQPEGDTFSVPIGSGHYRTHQSHLSLSSQRSSHSGHFESKSHLSVDMVIYKNNLRRTLTWLFTPTKIRFAFVIGLIGFCIWLFVNTAMAAEHEVIAFSQEHPYIWEIDSSNVEVLEAEILPQEPEDDFPDDPKIIVMFQGEHEEKWETISNWTVDLKHEDDSHYFDAYKESKYSKFQFKITTDMEEFLVGAQFHVAEIPKTVHYQELFAAIILIFAYGLIISEIIDRSLAAMVGALLAMSVYSTLHEAPSFEEIVAWIDYETTGLLFGMMIMVGVFSETGFFEWSAVKAYKIAKGNGKKKDSVVLMNLAIILCVFTAVVSAFLDNVTTILLLSKVTIRLCDVLGVDPVPILISEVLFSNIGGTATPIGDPPNIIVVNNDDVAEEVNFGNFFLHVCPGIIFAGFACVFVIRRQLAPYLKKRGAPLHVQREIQIWENTLKTLHADTDEERQVRKQLRQHIQTLLSIEEPDSAPPDITELERKYVIHDMNLFYMTAFILTIVILCFFVRSAFESSLTPAIIAIVGALTLLLAAGINKMEEVLRNVEWETLIFFSCLFVLMECLSELGLVDLIGNTTADLIDAIPAGKARLAVAVILIIWVSAIVSAFVDNIPYTAAMVPVIVQLAEDDDLPLQPLVWSLVYGSCLGGNGTLTGASANVVAAGISASNGYPISFMRFTKMGVPVTAVSLVCVTIYMLIFHVLIEWY